jgi:3-oxoacyl-[acyl-carrier-protein] synthase III
MTNDCMKITGIGYCLGNKLITNNDMEKLVCTTDEWIVSHTGIRQRYFCSKNQALSDMGKDAAKRAIKAAGLHPDEIGVIIVSSSTTDYQVGPFTATILKESLNLKNAWGFDMNVICPGIPFSIEIASGLISKYKNILVVCGEAFSKAHYFLKNRTTAVIFGDGASALVLSASKEKGLLNSYLNIKKQEVFDLGVNIGGSRNPLTQETFNDMDMDMDGPKIFNFAVHAFQESVNKVAAMQDLKPDQIDMIIPHQANKNIITEAMRRLNLPLNKTYINIDSYGNTGGGSIGIALGEAVEKSLIKKGNLIILVGYGSGLGWGANLIRW